MNTKQAAVKSVVISAAVIAMVICGLFLYRRTLLIKIFMNQNIKNYNGLKLDSCTIIDDNTNKTISLHLDPRMCLNTAEESIQLKLDFESFLNSHASLYQGYKIICTFSSDAEYGYIKYFNYDAVSIDAQCLLSYGEFKGDVGTINAINDSAQFEHLVFHDYKNLHDVSVFDSQKQLQEIIFEKCLWITEDDIRYLKKTHPDCEIIIKN